MGFTLNHRCIGTVHTGNIPGQFLIERTPGVAGYHGLIQLTARQRRINLFPLESISHRHLDIHTSIDRLGGRPCAQNPVRLHKPFEAPVFTQDIRQQNRMFTTVDAIHTIVGTHDRGGRAFNDTALEMRQIDLVQYPLISVRAHLEASHLEVVKGKVLGTGQHPVLSAGNIGDAHRTHVVGILGVRFLGPTPAWMTQQIDGGREDDIPSLGGNFSTCSHPNASFEFRIKRRAAGDRNRECGCLANPGTSWAISHFPGFDTKCGIAACIVKAVNRLHLPAVQLVNFLLKRQAAEQRIDLNADACMINLEPLVAGMNNLPVEGFDRTVSFHRPNHQAFRIVRPPSTGSTVPVIYCEAGSTKLSVPCATSSGSA